MATGDGILARARAHIGERYEHGIAPKDDPDWKGPWDCAEFASWLVFQESGKLYGCPDNVAPAKSDAYTGRWQEDSARKGLRIPVEQAAATPGAMLLRYPPSGGGMGHIAVSDGRGGTVEAMGRRYGVLKGKVAGRRWDTGVLVPGVDYASSGRRVPTPGPAVLFARNLPNMGGEAVKAIQRALKAKGFDPSGIDGDFGEATAQAVQAFQEAQGLVPDGEVGPETAKLLGVNLPGLAGAVAEVMVKGVVGANPLLAVATAVLPSIARVLAGDPGALRRRPSRARWPKSPTPPIPTPPASASPRIPSSRRPSRSASPRSRPSVTATAARPRPRPARTPRRPTRRAATTRSGR
jgi:peptidoglycan hydrolase-like protein with peptidoglycan-binding domain